MPEITVSLPITTSKEISKDITVSEMDCVTVTGILTEDYQEDFTVTRANATNVPSVWQTEEVTVAPVSITASLPVSATKVMHLTKSITISKSLSVSKVLTVTKSVTMTLPIIVSKQVTTTKRVTRGKIT